MKASRSNHRDSNCLVSHRLQVAVLGHTGFIGGNIREHLIKAGFTVTAASSQECDLLDADQVHRFLGDLPGGARLVVCSAISRLVEDSYGALCRNVQMAQNLAASAPRGRLAAVVYLSSVDVYGRSPHLPITERTLPAPASFYGISKLASEMLLRRPGALDCQLTVLRLPGVYGPGDGGRSIVGRFLAQMRQKGRVSIYGDGSVRRDFVEVGDICRVVRGVLEKPFDGVLNVATGTSLSIREVVETLAAAAGCSPAIDYGPEDPATAGDLVFDVASLRAHLPAMSFKDLHKGVAHYVVNA